MNTQANLPGKWTENKPQLFDRIMFFLKDTIVYCSFYPHFSLFNSKCKKNQEIRVSQPE